MKKFSVLIKEQSASEINGFCILKPEFLNYEDDFLKMLNNNGWSVIQKVKKKLSKDSAAELYKCHKDEDFYGDLCDYMSSDNCICYTCHKDCEDPIKDMDNLKDKVRKAWGKDDMRNAMHSSDSLANVSRESKLIFEGKITENMNDPCCCDKCCNGIAAPYYPDSYDPIVMKMQAAGLGKFTREECLKYYDMLVAALAEEFSAWYKYYIVIPFLCGEGQEEIAKLFKELAKDELDDHAQWLMQKLSTMNPPINIFNNWSSYVPCNHYVDNYTVNDLNNLTNNIKNETNAIETYINLVAFTKDKDEEGHKKLKSILKDEQEHLNKLQELVNKLYTK